MLCLSYVFIPLLNVMLIDTILGSGKPRALRGVGRVSGAPKRTENEKSYGLFRNGFRSYDRRQFSEISGGKVFDNYRGPITQSRGPENLSALMSIGVGFYSVDGAWGFVSAQVNSVCNYQGFRYGYLKPAHM